MLQHSRPHAGTVVNRGEREGRTHTVAEGTTKGSRSRSMPPEMPYQRGPEQLLSPAPGPMQQAPNFPRTNPSSPDFLPGQLESLETWNFHEATFGPPHLGMGLGQPSPIYQYIPELPVEFDQLPFDVNNGLVTPTSTGSISRCTTPGLVTPESAGSNFENVAGSSQQPPSGNFGDRSPLSGNWTTEEKVLMLRRNLGISYTPDMLDEQWAFAEQLQRETDIAQANARQNLSVPSPDEIYDHSSGAFVPDVPVGVTPEPQQPSPSGSRLGASRTAKQRGHARSTSAPYNKVSFQPEFVDSAPIPVPEAIPPHMQAGPSSNSSVGMVEDEPEEEDPEGDTKAAAERARKRRNESNCKDKVRAAVIVLDDQVSRQLERLNSDEREYISNEGSKHLAGQVVSVQQDRNSAGTQGRRRWTSRKNPDGSRVSGQSVVIGQAVALLVSQREQLDVYEDVTSPHNTRIADLEEENAALRDHIAHLEQTSASHGPAPMTSKHELVHLIQQAALTLRRQSRPATPGGMKSEQLSFEDCVNLAQVVMHYSKQLAPRNPTGDGQP